MTETRQIYRCPICGNVVEILNSASGTLVCCGKPMVLLKGNTSDGAVEKHVPVIEKTAAGYKVSVGSAAHPMLEEHYIQWIELLTPTRVYRKELKPGQAPEAVFTIKEEIVSAREYCNLHGLWKK